MPLAGDILVASDWGDLSDDSSQKPLVKLTQSAAQSIPNNTNTAISYVAAIDDIDTHNFHDPTTNPSRVTPTRAGYYTVRTTYWSAASNTLNFIETFARKNGTTSISPVGRTGGGGSNSSAAVATSQTFTASSTHLVAMNGTTDYLEHYVRQMQSTGTAAVNTGSSGNAFSCSMEVVYERDL